VKVLFKTERTPTVSKDMTHMGGTPACQGVTWFELVLHEGPADDTTWEGGGQTIAYWRENFARLRNPHPWTVRAPGAEGVAPAIIPDEVVQGLPEDARISLIWTFIPAELAART
jgi:hypothetical protein